MTILSNNFFSRWPIRVARHQIYGERRRRAWITFRGLEFIIFVIHFCLTTCEWVCARRMSQCTVVSKRQTKNNEKNERRRNEMLQTQWMRRQHERICRMMSLATFASFMCTFYDFCLLFSDYVPFSAPFSNRFAVSFVSPVSTIACVTAVQS